MTHVTAEICRLKEDTRLVNGEIAQAGRLLEPFDSATVRTYFLKGSYISVPLVLKELVTVVDFQTDSDGGLDAIIITKTGEFARIRADKLRATSNYLPGSPL